MALISDYREQVRTRHGKRISLSHLASEHFDANPEDMLR